MTKNQQQNDANKFARVAKAWQTFSSLSGILPVVLKLLKTKSHTFCARSG